MYAPAPTPRAVPDERARAARDAGVPRGRSSARAASSSARSPPRAASASAACSCPAWSSARSPRLVRPDPLLLDDEREALSPALRTTRDRQEAERLLFLDAVRAAEERIVLSYPRFDTAVRPRARALVVPPARARSRARPAAQHERPGAPGRSRARPRWAGRIPGSARSPSTASSATSRWPRAACPAPRATWPCPAASSCARSRRSTPPGTAASRAWDGVVDHRGAEALARLRLAGQVSSASAVQTLRRSARTATCSTAGLEPPRVGGARDAPTRSRASTSAPCTTRSRTACSPSWRSRGGLPLREDAAGGARRAHRRAGGRGAGRVRRRGRHRERRAAGAGARPPAQRPRGDAARPDRRPPTRATRSCRSRSSTSSRSCPVPLGDGASISFRGKIDRLDVAAGSRPRPRHRLQDRASTLGERTPSSSGGRELQLAIYNRAAARGCIPTTRSPRRSTTTRPRPASTSARPAPPRPRSTRRSTRPRDLTASPRRRLPPVADTAPSATSVRLRPLRSPRRPQGDDRGWPPSSVRGSREVRDLTAGDAGLGNRLASASRHRATQTWRAPFGQGLAKGSRRKPTGFEVRDRRRCSRHPRRSRRC